LNQRHGWDSHPRICRGFWKIENLFLKNKNSSESRLTNISINHRNAENSFPSLQKLLHEIDYIILKSNGDMKVGNNSNVQPLGWEFTPANRRILFEVKLVQEKIILRYSAQITRVPKVVTRALGNVRMRTSNIIENGSNHLSDFKVLPSSDSSWPVIAQFGMNQALYGKHGRYRDRAAMVKKGLLTDGVSSEGAEGCRGAVRSATDSC